MNKTDLIAAVAEKSALSKKDAEKAVNAVITTIEESLKNNEKVQIVGFGVFEAKSRPARKGHNPMTGKEIDIPASKAPSFKAGKAFKDALNYTIFHRNRANPAQTGSLFPFYGALGSPGTGAPLRARSGGAPCRCVSL